MFDGDGKEVTTVDVPGGASISVNGNDITIGGKTFTAVPSAGGSLTAFLPNSGTIKNDTSITVVFTDN